MGWGEACSVWQCPVRESARGSWLARRSFRQSPVLALSPDPPPDFCFLFIVCFQLSAFCLSTSLLFLPPPPLLFSSPFQYSFSIVISNLLSQCHENFLTFQPNRSCFISAITSFCSQLAIFFLSPIKTSTLHQLLSIFPLVSYLLVRFLHHSFPHHAFPYSALLSLTPFSCFISPFTTIQSRPVLIFARSSHHRASFRVLVSSSIPPPPSISSFICFYPYLPLVSFKF